jgi:hypothetical protein
MCSVAEALGIVQGFGLFAVKYVLPPPQLAVFVVRRLGGCSAASSVFLRFTTVIGLLLVAVDLGGPLGKGCCALLGDRGSTAQKILSQNHRPTQRSQPTDDEF